MKALSLHIGLNSVDPTHYDNWDGALVGCEFDAKDMQAIARARGFKPTVLLTPHATAKAVKTAISHASKSLAAGDIFFITYSGHGGQVPDLNGDEGKSGDTRDRKDETWCLFDRELVDDELADLWSKFKNGVRVIVLSDSCHSGSVTRAVPRRQRGRPRAMPREKALRVYEKNQPLYDAIQLGVKGAEVTKIKASVLLISGCMDNQTSSDGDRNGYFTETLRAVWNDAEFENGYREFRDTIAAKMEDQTPNYFVIGVPNREFENEQPFTVKAKKKSATKAARALTAAPPRKTRGGGGAIDIVLSCLNAVGYRDAHNGLANPGSDISDWFRRAAQDDQEHNLPGAGRVGMFIGLIGERLGVDLAFARLIAGVYKTPQDIADLA